jgi:hypothetical protein
MGPSPWHGHGTIFYDPVIGVSNTKPVFDKEGKIIVACDGCPQGRNLQGLKWSNAMTADQVCDAYLNWHDELRGCRVYGPLSFRRRDRKKVMTIVRDGRI